MVLTVLLQRGLPSWLTLNNTTGELSGTAPQKFNGNFQPDVYEGLELWLSADNAPGGEGDTIYKWPDDSGNDYHADNVQGNPTLKISALNGHSVIAFDGSDDLLWTSQNFDGLANGYTLFTVSRYAGNPKGRVIGSKLRIGFGVTTMVVCTNGTPMDGSLTMVEAIPIGIYIAEILITLVIHKRTSGPMVLKRPLITRVLITLHTNLARWHLVDSGMVVTVSILIQKSLKWLCIIEFCLKTNVKW